MPTALRAHVCERRCLVLGCQDFCGYYDWTFSFLREHAGQDAVEKYWAKAVVDAQQHYTEAGRAAGLRGLYDTWVQTGDDEKCDWTFTLDEDRNVLRWDMRQCPSKGHLIKNDLYTDEDYCDHCMGWALPLLGEIGVEVTAHEHNHCGQCWSEIRMKDQPFESLASHVGDINITKDARWDNGYIDGWRSNVKLPLLQEQDEATDSVDVIEHWFADANELTVLGRGPSAVDEWTAQHLSGAVIVTDPTYASRDVYDDEPRGVLMGDNSPALAEVAKRFLATPEERRPLLMHMYLPGAPMQPFARYGLPRPVPILPMLVRHKLYQHQSFAAYPTTGVFALLLAAAISGHKRVNVAGIDLYQHPTDQVYVNDQVHHGWPAQHSEACDRAAIQCALTHLDQRAQVHPFLRQLLTQPA